MKCLIVFLALKKFLNKYFPNKFFVLAKKLGGIVQTETDSIFNKSAQKKRFFFFS